jgi:UDP-N-acetylmuramate dehydrogenase
MRRGVARVSAETAALTCLIQENASLRRYNTFGVEARARWLVRLRVPEALPELLSRESWAGARLIVLGDGSNVLFRDDFDGIVLKLDCQRVEVVGEDERGTLVRAEAGRNWHAFVNYTIERGYAGLENLSLIPGTVGAAPVQNIGAYGVELDRYVEAVEAYDRVEQRFVWLPNAACGFSYRTSIFKTPEARERYVIIAVRFRLPKSAELVTSYPGVREELAAMKRDTPTARDVADAICAIRRRKLPDPAKLGNAGSFFKNPVVSRERAEQLRRVNPPLPVYPFGRDEAKLAAAWLIEQCDYKGHREGDAGIADTHALVLVNYGHATGAQLWSLAERVAGEVKRRFGVQLEPEPLVVS